MRELKAVVIRPEGGVDTISLLENEADRLAQIQSLVGGYVEVVALPGSCYIAMNENGKSGSHQANYVATAIAHKDQAISLSDYIAGTAVLLPMWALS